MLKERIEYLAHGRISLRAEFDQHGWLFLFQDAGGRPSGDWRRRRQGRVAERRLFGCQFDKRIPKAALSAAMLRNPFEAAAPAPPAIVPGKKSEALVGAEDDRASFAVRMRVILGTSLLLWALILWALGVF